MPQVNLSNMSGAELRGLLDSTRQRGMAAQSYEILQEMAARRAQAEGGKTPKRSGRKGEGRVIAVDLGDPLDRAEELVDPVVEPPPPSEPLDDIGMDLAQAVQDRTPRRKVPRERKARPPVAGPQAVRRKRWPAVVFAGGVGLGVLLGCGLALDSLSKPDTAALAVFPQAPMLRAEQAPPPAEPPAPVAVAEAPPPAEAPAPELAAAEASEAAVPASAEQVENPNAMDDKLAELAANEPPAADRCARAGTPADRTICEEPRLKDLQKELRDAYAEALEAHADRALLRQRQLAWRDARNDIDDPEKLARLYESRIRKLHAAAEAAREAR